jgi:arylsulfatase A-like enzyme
MTVTTEADTAGSLRAGFRPRSATRSVAAALLLGLLPTCGPSDALDEPDARNAEHPNVVFWLVDTLRADHLGTYGYERDTSPVLDALAADGVLFEQAHVHSNWTQPSVTSLLTGCYPPTFSAGFTDVVPESLTMAQEWFGEHGYATAGMTVTLATAERYGFGRGFRVYEELDARATGRKTREGPEFDADKVVDAAVKWLDNRWDDSKPFFLYLHSVDPHAPYETHEGQPSFVQPYDGPIDGGAKTISDALKSGYPFTDADKQHLIDLYDDEVLFNDAQLGVLLEQLESRGLRDDTLIVVVSDHGEEFWDRRTHGHGHRNLHEELTRTPLVFSWPRGLPAGQRIDGLMPTINLLPTLVELCGLPELSDIDGESVANIVRDSGQLTGRGAVHYSHRAKEGVDVMAVRTPEVLLHADPQGLTTGLYDLRQDPDAMRDQREAQVDLAETLKGRLFDWHKRLQSRAAAWQRGDAEMDAEQRAGLEAMGYLGADKQDG